ncbi:MAG: SUMF1/EgtB/PvdO family nonheme iron enzyme [Candidatus Xenobiia bacterium LiM19]
MFCSRYGHPNRDTAKFCQQCGEPLVQVLQAGSTLDRGRYEVKKSLKSGGMGAVYLIRDHRLERECVLKEMVPPSQDPLELKEFKVRFKNEALTLSKLSHRNLPRVTDHFEEGSQCFLVMDYIDGDDLESLLAKSSPKGFSEEKVRGWALEILSVLEYLHGQTPLILYRDLKPSNIMVRNADGALFLVDFGLAKSVHAALTHKTSWGTEGYAPLEQCQGEPEVRSDLYSLGATMHHLLSGKPPTPFKFNPIGTLRPDISDSLAEVVDRSLKLHAHERYEDAGKMREALEGKGAEQNAGTPAKKAFAPAQKAGTPVKMAGAPVKIVAAPAKVVQSPAPAATLPSKMQNTKDGAEMVLVPAGEFLMGSPSGEGSDEHPQHRVYLDAYYIYKYPVTNGQFARFVKETGYGAEGDWEDFADPGREDHPVLNVTWKDARAYCKWADGRLPMEAEWEKAARGTDGREYPWGNTWDDSKCNWDKGPKVPGMADIYGGRGTTPVGSFPSGASPYGCMDMAGNVWEWCSDWYDEDYYKNSPSRNPSGPSKGGYRVSRGGSWYVEDTGIFRCAYRFRYSPVNRINLCGFRVCRPSNTR